MTEAQTSRAQRLVRNPDVRRLSADGFRQILLSASVRGGSAAATLTRAAGTAERDAALSMRGGIHANPRATMGGVAACDAWRFKQVGERGRIPSMARLRKETWRGAACLPPPGRDPLSPLCQRNEESFGWIKNVEGQSKTSFRRRQRVEASFIFAVAANNPVRMPKLLAAGP